MGDPKSLSRLQWREAMAEMGEKPFRGDILFQWLHQRHAISYDEMTDLPKGLRASLAENMPLAMPVVQACQRSSDGTVKYLVRLGDDRRVECVLMKYKFGYSLCISSQAGCRMGCRFCASTLDGLVRSLTASEMLAQIYEIQRITGERISNIVMMGSGEPLDNYEQAVRFIRLVSDEKGLHISQRNITLSTCGLVPKIRQLAEEKLAVTLAISLHASTDEKRRDLMPVAKKYSIQEILDACREYFEKTGRRISFEYALAAGQNDFSEDAERLAGLLKGFPCHVNLIPVNPVRERNFDRSAHKVVQAFQNKLENCGINGTIRREMGSDINGACGQLRKSYLDKNS
ncbi:MAG: 23S rRNA (adenine(2503)-C(2))-methyltransferase RlmN [Lachnospiraceae bacterium]|nr:23S rRNA (adenine(2503)-C(2))-methyltransferase RlmN [Lachnospiraceae bacterium]